MGRCRFWMFATVIADDMEFENGSECFKSTCHWMKSPLPPVG